MSHTPEACYLPIDGLGPRGGELVESTRLSAAIWYPDGQHGGVVAALMARAVVRQPTLTEMEVVRVTVELFRIVPVTVLEVVTALVREGKKIQTTAVDLYAGDVHMATGLVQRLRVKDLGRTFEAAAPPRPPEDLVVERFADVLPFREDGQVSFSENAVEVAHPGKSFSEMGAKAVWYRITCALLRGETMTPLERAVISADFSNGMSRLANPGEIVFMNSDLTVQLARYPEGDWIALEGESIWDRGGRGGSNAVLFDRTGAFGSGAQSLFLDT